MLLLTHTRSRAACVAALALAAGACAPPASAPATDAGADPFAVVAAADRAAARELWPGFDPRTTPVAIYDGTRTLLFRHPSPPGGFEPLAGHPAVMVYAGRFPAVTANTSTEIGGVPTATLMPVAGTVTALARAATLVHETFHVYQRRRHPSWAANEAELFAYPVDDANLLALRRLEWEALRRALAARRGSDAACWTHEALALRGERFAAIGRGAAGYERGTELNEGLATYVERRVSGAPDSTLLGPGEVAAEAIRQRGYRSGAAIGRLLDRFDPAWRDELERNDSTPLEALLTRAVASKGRGETCAFTGAERQAVAAAASADVAALQARRAEARRAFAEQPGWSVRIVSASPLFPQGFDPLNVQAVGRGELLHTRYVKLGNGAGAVEVLGHASLSEDAGSPSLFGGVRALTVTGLSTEPAVTASNGAVTLQAEGVTADFRGATVERDGRTITLRLPGGS